LAEDGVKPAANKKPVKPRKARPTKNQG
jgi:hypothetical protein